MGLLKTSTASICLSDDAINEELMYDDPQRAMLWIQQHKYTVNPINIRMETLKTVLD